MACRFRKRTFRHLAIAFSLALFAPFASVVRAQTFDTTHLRQPANLDAKWLVQAGDDPAYASADFDDSRWLLFDPSRSITPLFPKHPEVIWYRLHVKIDPPDRGLALSEVKVAGAFEIYVNGERLIASGRIAPFVPYTSDARLVGRIPDRMLASGSVVIALRVHFSPLEWTVGQNPGLYADNLAIGQERTLYRDNWLYSDGVIEAQRPDGELFGFERAREVSVRPAAEIVETVKRFGQEDDITVVTVTRTTTVATAA